MASVRQILKGEFSDARIGQALAQARSGDASALIALAKNLIDYSTARIGFGNFIEAANRTIIDNLQDGGPVLTPSSWKLGQVLSFSAPTLKIDGETVTITDSTCQNLVFTATPETLQAGTSATTLAGWARNAASTTSGV